MNACKAAVVEGDLAQPALSKLPWKNYSSVLRISFDINSSPMEPRTVAKSGAIINKAPLFFEESNVAWIELIFYR